MYIVETKKNGLDGSVENNIVIITQWEIGEMLFQEVSVVLFMEDELKVLELKVL
jgi:hypothetical protein